MLKQSLAFAVLFISTAAFQKEDLRCPSVVGKLPNLELKGISKEALPYLKRYSVPTAEGRGIVLSALHRAGSTHGREHEARCPGTLHSALRSYAYLTQTFFT